MKKLIHALFIMAAVIVTAAAAAHATMLVERMSLERVTREATRIVHGTVTGVESGRDKSGLPATWITIDVAAALKGSPARQVTIKQYGVDRPLADGTITRVAGLPRYRLGEEVVLFLRGESDHGFTSPVGFGQGVYRVSRGATKTQVRRDVPDAQRTPSAAGKQDLDEFLSEVSRHLTASK